MGVERKWVSVRLGWATRLGHWPSRPGNECSSANTVLSSSQAVRASSHITREDEDVEVGLLRAQGTTQLDSQSSVKWSKGCRRSPPFCIREQWVSMAALSLIIHHTWGQRHGCHHSREGKSWAWELKQLAPGQWLKAGNRPEHRCARFQSCVSSWLSTLPSSSFPLMEQPC